MWQGAVRHVGPASDVVFSRCAPVMVQPEDPIPLAVVSDLGSVRFANTGVPSSCRRKSVLPTSRGFGGTPGYEAPEALQGSHVSQAADVFRCEASIPRLPSPLHIRAQICAHAHRITVTCTMTHWLQRADARTIAQRHTQHWFTNAHTVTVSRWCR